MHFLCGIASNCEYSSLMPSLLQNFLKNMHTWKDAAASKYSIEQLSFCHCYLLFNWPHKHLLYSHILLLYANFRFCICICSYSFTENMRSSLSFCLHNRSSIAQICAYIKTADLCLPFRWPMYHLPYALRRWDKMTLVRLVQHTSQQGKLHCFPQGKGYCVVSLCSTPVDHFTVPITLQMCNEL